MSRTPARVGRGHTAFVYRQGRYFHTFPALAQRLRQRGGFLVGRTVGVTVGVGVGRWSRGRHRAWVAVGVTVAVGVAVGVAVADGDGAVPVSQAAFALSHTDTSVVSVTPGGSVLEQSPAVA